MKVRNAMAHWPSDPVPRLARAADMANGDSATVTTISMCAHTGTHMDAPLHFIQGGASIDQMPLDATVGPARVIRVDTSGPIGRKELEPHRPAAGERLLIRSNNSQRARDCRLFLKQFAHIAPDGAQFLADCGIRTLGVDYLSVGAYEGDTGPITHRILLGREIWLIEGLDLSAVEPGDYDLVCLPLKLTGADGAPARALLRPLQ